MASITTWMRIEPHSLVEDMDAGLEMRIHDPLWGIARQWQFGEFWAEDTGSPVWIAYEGEKMPIRLFLPGPIDGHKTEDVQTYLENEPLEYLVEQERTAAKDAMLADHRLAIEAGQQFLRFLPETLLKKYRTKLLQSYSVKALSQSEQANLDPDSLAFLNLMAGRALDGAQLLEKIQAASPQTSATVLGFDTTDATTAMKTVNAWLDWCEQLVGSVTPPASTTPAKRTSSWIPERMEYACAVAAAKGNTGDQAILAASEYPGGHLDWYSFDSISKPVKLNKETGANSESIQSGTLPTNLNFKGLPSNRLWEFEDAQVSFGSIEAASTDLARQLLVEFLLEYGNDFFIIPIEVEAGSLFQLDKLTITNTFGDVTSSLPFATQDWRLFALSDDSTSPVLSSSALFIPPVLGQHFASPPIEDVLFLRDEMANIAWAVEHVVESKIGRPLNRHEVYQAQRQSNEAVSKPPVGSGTLIYHLDTLESTLPDYWIPLMPESPTPGQVPMRLVSHDPQKRAQSRLLTEQGSSFSVFDEEVPRTGANVKRTHQYTRWYNGGIFSWAGREKRPGHGEGSSGLRFDVVELG